MTIATLVTALLVVALLVVAVRLAVLIRADGRGHRAPPRSHHDWTDSVPDLPRRLPGPATSLTRTCPVADPDLPRR